MGPPDTFPHVLAAAQAGAGWAFERLFRAHQPRLVRYLRAQAGSDGDDVAADTWLSVARGLPGFAGTEDDFRGWLFTIARRRLHDHHRRVRARPRAVATDAALTGRASSDDVAGDVAGDDAARRIVAALGGRDADIVLLRVVGGFSAAEVAAITGRRTGAVRVAQHRALRRLARVLDTDPEQPVTDGAGEPMESP